MVTVKEFTECRCRCLEGIATLETSNHNCFQSRFFQNWSAILKIKCLVLFRMLLFYGNETLVTKNTFLFSGEVLRSSTWELNFCLFLSIYKFIKCVKQTRYSRRLKLTAIQCLIRFQFYYVCI